MLESLDNVSGHPGRSNLDLAGIPRKLTFNLANLSGHPGRKMYPGRDRIAWSGYNPPVINGTSEWPSRTILAHAEQERNIVKTHNP